MTDHNLIQTFQLEKSNIRGRILRMDTVLHTMLERHGYPEPLQYLTAEVAVFALLLSSMLKYDGIFTLQIQGDGPVSMVVADVTAGGVRACAKFNAGEDLPKVEYPLALVGKGYMAFTVDQGPDTERYQGIVALDGKDLSAAVQHYFTQSEQIQTALHMVLGRDGDGVWRAGAIMLQKLPDESNGAVGDDEHDDGWNNATIMMKSCTAREFLDTSLSLEDILFRLFHEDGVRVYPPQKIEETCRCSQDRAQNIIHMMSDDEKIEMTDHGKITITCEFCNRTYEFDMSGGKPHDHLH